MLEVRLVDRKDYWPEPGSHVARVERAEKTETRVGEAVRFSYRTEDGPIITEFTNPIYTPKSKLGRRIKAILGEMPQEVYAEDLIGRKVRVTAEEREDSEYLRVVEVEGLAEEKEEKKEDPGVPF